MSKQVTSCNTRVLKSCIGILFSVLAIACSKDNSSDFCRDHRLYHANHVDEIGNLNIEMSESGRVLTDLIIPDFHSGSVDSLDELLSTPSNIYTVQSDLGCSQSDVAIGRESNTVITRFESDCGADNKIGQIDVTLFDRLPTIDEIAVQVTTPAASKRFLINRQCEAAIFRFE